MTLRVRVGCLAVLLLGALSVGAFAQEVEVGLISLFDLAMGARPVGMGEAFLALADDEYAVLYNPAGLASLERVHAGMMLEGRFGGASAGLGLAAMRNVGLGLLFFNGGQIVRRDGQGTETGTFNYGQFAGVLSAGFGLEQLPLPFRLALLKDMALGTALKFYQVNTLADGSGSGFALDVSGLWRVGRLRLGGNAVDLRTGLAVSNLLSKGIEYGSGHSESWRLGLGLGLAATVQETLTLAGDLTTRDGLHLGLEYRLRNLPAGQLALRAGFSSRGGAFSLGLGYLLQDLRVDYALSTQARLPMSHKLSASFAFDLGGLFG